MKTHAKADTEWTGLTVCLPQLRRVVGQDDQLGLALSQSLECLSVAQDVLAGLDDQLESAVDALHGLFLHTWRGEANGAREKSAITAISPRRFKFRGRRGESCQEGVLYLRNPSLSKPFLRQLVL